jgi:holo-[acyl-carrier protein] synthase
MSKREIDLMNASYTTEEAKQQFAAGRWAAKESIVKASSKKIIFSDIEILAGLCGKPTIYINGEKTEDILVSISHEDEHSIAVAIIK